MIEIMFVQMIQLNCMQYISVSQPFGLQVPVDEFFLFTVPVLQILGICLQIVFFFSKIQRIRLLFIDLA
jgi:hypothetical protein